jgi:RHS repeat-associated protein
VATKDGSTGAYLVADLHGSLALAEASGSTGVLDAIRYDGYGQTLDAYLPTGSISLDTKYQGRLDLSATDDPLYDLSARLYAPGLGTFTSLDSVMGSAQDPASLNRFLYAEANPTTFTDPTGHRVCEAYCEESAPRASETKHERAVGAKAGKQRERRNHQREFQDSKKAGGASNQKTIWIPPSLETWLNWSDEWRSWYIGNYLAEAEEWSAWGQDDASVIVHWILMKGAPWIDLPSTFERFDDATIDRLSDAVFSIPSEDTVIAAATFRFGGEQYVGAAALAPTSMQFLGGARMFGSGSAGSSVDSVEVGSAGGAASCPDFVVTENGNVIVVPKGAVGPTDVQTGKGFQYRGGSGGNGLDERVTDVRIMDPKSDGRYPYPNGYVSYGNGAQTVNPKTGLPDISRSDPLWHIPLSGR